VLFVSHPQAGLPWHTREDWYHWAGLCSVLLRVAISPSCNEVAFSDAELAWSACFSRREGGATCWRWQQCHSATQLFTAAQASARMPVDTGHRRRPEQTGASPSHPPRLGRPPQPPCVSLFPPRLMPLLLTPSYSSSPHSHPQGAPSQDELSDLTGSPPPSSKQVMGLDDVQPGRAGGGAAAEGEEECGAGAGLSLVAGTAGRCDGSQRGQVRESGRSSLVGSCSCPVKCLSLHSSAHPCHP